MTAMRLSSLLGMTAALMAATAAFAAVRAQEVAANCGATGGAVVAGTVVDDSTNRPIAGSRVHLLVPLCGTTADAQGRFHFDGVQPGTQRLDTGQPGYRGFSPVLVQAAAGDTIRVELRLRPGGPIEDCRALPACAPLLAAPAPAEMDEEARLRLAAYGAAIAIAWSSVVRTDPAWACVEGATPAIIAELARRYSHVAVGEACAIDSAARDIDEVRHRPTDERGFFIRIGPVEDRGDGTRRATLAYMSGRRAGQEWWCDLARTASGWRPGLCMQVREY